MKQRNVQITRVQGGKAARETDVVAAEEPLEIQIGYSAPGGREEKSLSITMRTPGNDEELAAGFLFTEGILPAGDAVAEIWHRSPPVPGSDLRNVIRVDLAEGVHVDIDRLQRHFYTTSSCGVCGKASLDALAVQSQFADDIRDSTFSIAASRLPELPERLMSEQAIFGSTGGLHAAALLDENGVVQPVREDVGRHNAMDKLIGRLLLDERLPIKDHGILVSGRTSFELVQKVAMAGCPMLLAVGAPSSLAVETAEAFGVTLVGFLRDERFNVYAGEERIR